MADDFKLTEDNREEVKEEFYTALERALEAVGIEAQGDVSLKAPVDTGLLRNSITYAVDGHSIANRSYHANNFHARTNVTRKSGTAGKMLNAVRIGRYEGGAVTSGEGRGTKVYIGTNVEYAPYVEMGTSRTKAQPFLSTTLRKNNKKYEQILRDYLSNGMEN